MGQAKQNPKASLGLSLGISHRALGSTVTSVQETEMNDSTNKLQVKNKTVKRTINTFLVESF